MIADCDFFFSSEEKTATRKQIEISKTCIQNMTHLIFFTSIPGCHLLLYLTRKRKKISNYNLVIKTRVLNKRTNLGKIYFVNIYIITISKIKAKVIWFKK